MGNSASSSPTDNLHTSLGKCLRDLILRIHRKCSSDAVRLPLGRSGISMHIRGPRGREIFPKRERDIVVMISMSASHMVDNTQSLCTKVHESSLVSIWFVG